MSYTSKFINLVSSMRRDLLSLTIISLFYQIFISEKYIGFLCLATLILVIILVKLYRLSPSLLIIVGVFFIFITLIGEIAVASVVSNNASVWAYLFLSLGMGMLFVGGLKKNGEDTAEDIK